MKYHYGLADTFFYGGKHGYRHLRCPDNKCTCRSKRKCNNTKVVCGSL